MHLLGMNWLRTGSLIAIGVMAASVAGLGAASAQYYGGSAGYERGYERRDYDRDRRGQERRYDRSDRDDRRRSDGYDRGNRGRYETNEPRGSRPGRDAYDPRGPRPGANPMHGMSIEDQKRAIKNHREAQKKAIKRGYVIP